MRYTVRRTACSSGASRFLLAGERDSFSHRGLVQGMVGRAVGIRNGVSKYRSE
jgi:hypothetical protein